MTARQFYITLFMIVVSLKVQKLPSLISESLGKDSYLLVLAFLAVNLVGIFLAFFILKRTKNMSLSEKSKSAVGMVFKKILLLGMAVYFLSQCMLLYESIQNLFAHVLFYELPWTMFSLMLAGAVFYLAYTGIGNISLNFELYAVLILISYIVISIFGGTKADFSAVLPLETINFKQIGEKIIDFNLWFGDFFLVLFMGKHAKHIKLKWVAFVYTAAMLFVSLLFVEFFGIYENYTPMKPSLISVLSEQSMLGVNIGRVDWFFILFTEIGTILSAGACLFFAKKCLSFVFPKIKEHWLLLFLTIVIYFVDIFYLVDVHTQKELFMKFMPYVSLTVKLVSLVSLLFISFMKNNKNSQENNEKIEQNAENFNTQDEYFKPKPEKPKLKMVGGKR